MSDSEDALKTRRYRIVSSLKKEAESHVQRYYDVLRDIRAVIKDNKLTDGQKKTLVLSMQAEMTQCKLKLEQLELLSVGGISFSQGSDIIKH